LKLRIIKLNNWSDKVISLNHSKTRNSRLGSEDKLLVYEFELTEFCTSSVN